MSYAEELSKNYNAVSDNKYFSKVSTIISTILEYAEMESYSKHSLQGYFSYGGYEESTGIYADITYRTNPCFFHIEDFGKYKDGILKYNKTNRQIFSMENSKKAIDAIRKELVGKGFKNIIVEERKISNSHIEYGIRKKTFLEMRKKHKNDGDTMPLTVEMPLYMLYISISW